MTPEQIAQFKENLNSVIDFFDTSIIWSPLYAVLILFLVTSWLTMYVKLRAAKKEIKALKFIKERLFEEQVELKSKIKSFINLN